MGLTCLNGPHCDVTCLIYQYLGTGVCLNAEGCDVTCQISPKSMTPLCLFLSCGVSKVAHSHSLGKFGENPDLRRQRTPRHGKPASEVRKSSSPANPEAQKSGPRKEKKDRCRRTPRHKNTIPEVRKNSSLVNPEARSIISKKKKVCRECVRWMI